MRSAGGDAEKLAFLHRVGVAAAGHSRGSVLSHVVGTRDLLAAWDAPAELCDAGLFHAAYGTWRIRRRAHREAARREHRRAVVALVGERAERLAWLAAHVEPFGLAAWMARGAEGALPLGDLVDAPPALPGDPAALANLVVANALEQLPRRHLRYRRRMRPLRALSPWLLPGAADALARECGLRPAVRHLLTRRPKRVSRDPGSPGSASPDPACPARTRGR